MSATTPVWIPLVAAGAGFAAAIVTGIVAQGYASRREDVRWGRERQDRQQQWQREDAQRWLQDKQAAYARLTAALYSWDKELGSAKTRRELDEQAGKRTELDWAELNGRASAAHEALAPVLFIAPRPIRTRASLAVSHRTIASGLLRREASLSSGVLTWNKLNLKDDVDSLQEAMRDDLGLEVKPGWSVDRESGHLKRATSEHVYAPRPGGPGQLPGSSPRPWPSHGPWPWPGPWPWR
jgi:hypothetical protein